MCQFFQKLFTYMNSTSSQQSYDIGGTNLKLQMVKRSTDWLSNVLKFVQHDEDSGSPVREPVLLTIILTS